MNTIKSLIPNLFYLLGYLLGLVATGLAKISVALINYGTVLHIKFKTELGMVINKYLETYKKIFDSVLTDKQQDRVGKEIKVTKSNTGPNDRLYNILKGNSKNESKV